MQVGYKNDWVEMVWYSPRQKWITLTVTRWVTLANSSYLSWRRGLTPISKNTNTTRTLHYKDEQNRIGFTLRSCLDRVS